MKMLIIEDDQDTSHLLAATLSEHHYVVDVIADGAIGLELAAQWSYDLILLDIMLPTLNGIEVCRQLRARGYQMPILMLTAKEANEDVIAGLDAGADDYVAKSCDQSQLLARVRALLRRSGRVAAAPVLTWGQLQLDPALAQVIYADRPIALRPKEYSLLELFLRYPQRILSRSNIIDHLWSMEETPVEGSVTNLIKDLRQRLKSAGMVHDFIETVYGLGYRLKAAPADPAPVDPAPADPALSSSQRLTSVRLPDQTQDRPSDQTGREWRGRAAIQQITDRFRTSLEQRLGSLETALRSLQTGALSGSQRRATQEEAHKLAGGLGTFGYEKASEIARRIERLLETAGQEISCDHQFAQLLADLRQELAQPPAPTARSHSSGVVVSARVSSMPALPQQSMAGSMIGR